MLFRREILQGIAEGRVTLAFRRWRRAPPADGSSVRSPVGVLCLDRVTVVDEGDITMEDVRHATQLIADRPGIVSRVLARQVDSDVPPFKRRVRQLKELGLTESLEVGYRLSPRGRAVLEGLVRDPRWSMTP
jgi:hypothetical protein